MDKYVVVHGDTLPGVAEKLGHGGEWLALANANLDLIPDELDVDDLGAAHMIAERMTVGTELMLPVEWAPEPVAPPPPATKTSSSASTSTSKT